MVLTTNGVKSRCERESEYPVCQGLYPAFAEDFGHAGLELLEGCRAVIDYPLAYFDQTDSKDTTQATRGETFELFWNPIQYIRVGAQYTAYDKYAGASSNYDGFGRNASDNNTLFLYVWAAY